MQHGILALPPFYGTLRQSHLTHAAGGGGGETSSPRWSPVHLEWRTEDTQRNIEIDLSHSMEHNLSESLSFGAATAAANVKPQPPARTHTHTQSGISQIELSFEWNVIFMLLTQPGEGGTGDQLNGAADACVYRVHNSSKMHRIRTLHTAHTTRTPGDT